MTKTTHLHSSAESTTKGRKKRQCCWAYSKFVVSRCVFSFRILFVAFRRICFLSTIWVRVIRAVVAQPEPRQSSIHLNVFRSQVSFEATVECECSPSTVVHDAFSGHVSLLHVDPCTDTTICSYELARRRTIAVLACVHCCCLFNGPTQYSFESNFSSSVWTRTLECAQTNSCAIAIVIALWVYCRCRLMGQRIFSFDAFLVVCDLTQSVHTWIDTLCERLVSCDCLTIAAISGDRRIFPLMELFFVSLACAH